MRRVIIPLMLLLFIAVLINGCKNKQQGDDQKKTERTPIEVDRDNIRGIWLRVSPGTNPEQYEGFSLNEDGTLIYQNSPTILGHSWELNHDTLVLFSKTDNPDQKRASHFIVYEAVGNSLTLKPMRSANENVQKFRRSEVSLANTSPEDALASYIHFLKKADATGVQSLLVISRNFSISKPMNITDYTILSSTKLTQEAAEAIPISPKLREGDIQLEVEQIVGGTNKMNYTYWFREKGFGNWGLVIWSYKRGS